MRTSTSVQMPERRSVSLRSLGHRDLSPHSSILISEPNVGRDLDPSILADGVRSAFELDGLPGAGAVGHEVVHGDRDVLVEFAEKEP